MHTDDQQHQEAKPPDDPRQRELDFVRGEQLSLLQQCELPKDEKDSSGKGVSATVLKAILTAIDHHGRGRIGGCYAGIGTLAANANIGKRTATRAVEVLQRLGLICVTNDGTRYGMHGSPTNRYTIVWTELDMPRYKSALERGGSGASRNTRANDTSEGRSADRNRPFARVDQSATRTDQSATRTDQSATRTDQSATVAHKSSPNRQEAQLNAPTVDSGEDGARYFFGDEVAAVRDKANRITRWADARSYSDRELVLKVATLWQDGKLADDTIGQVLESYPRSFEKGERIKNPMAWFWTALRNKVLEHHAHGRGERLERLLASTEFPRELLPPPSSRGGARVNGEGKLELTYAEARR